MAQLGSFDPPAGATVVRDVTGTFNRADWLLGLADAKDATRNVALGWSASGELVSKTTAALSRTLRWDGRGALVSVVDNGVGVGRYDYDASGLRVKRRTAAENVEYVLDEKHVLQEASGAVPEHPAYRRYHYAAEPLLVVDGAVGRFIGTDALGSPTDLTSATGQVAVKRQYDAWGQYRNGTAPAAGEAKLGFTGHQYDPETGLVYARARYYDPEIGRFVSRDTYEGEQEDAPSLHRFAYAWMNPLRFFDLTGHDVGQAEQAEEERNRAAQVEAFIGYAKSQDAEPGTEKYREAAQACFGPRTAKELDRAGRDGQAQACSGAVVVGAVQGGAEAVVGIVGGTVKAAWWPVRSVGKFSFSTSPTATTEVVKHPAVLVTPIAPARAVAHVRSWLDRPNVAALEPGPRHLEILGGLLDALGVAGNLTTDAQLAALAIEHQCELHSSDGDFARFSGLRWRNPL